jgi:two-component system sensor histidine kinase/response regulator
MARFKATTLPVRTKLETDRVAKGSNYSRLSLRVLLAEDNSVNQRLIRRLLEKRGHEVDVVGNGVEALRAVATKEFDLVLMDMQMPELDGLETTKRIRMKETGRDRHQLVVALTANAMSEDEGRCRAAGMDGYLTKPIQLEKLEEVLQKCASQVAAQLGTESHVSRRP